ncbi:MAG: hypothetical protein DRN96_08265 [Thermoproteota archaeon]|nr:MAG: hypothetical protein DRN96_08265 [Candidatus Korarchaeota archaeon]
MEVISLVGWLKASAKATLRSIRATTVVVVCRPALLPAKQPPYEPLQPLASRARATLVAAGLSLT